MERKILTWEELANKISQMSTSERKERVKVWPEGHSLRDDVCLTKESEDMCYDEDYPEDGCDLISNFEENSSIKVALPAGKYYLYA